MRLNQYLYESKIAPLDPKQEAWDKRLEERVLSYHNSFQKPPLLYEEFERRIRTEELKAWYSSPNPGDLFQGTSVSSLVIPATFEKPLNIHSISQLEEIIADQYILAHDRYVGAVENAIIEPIDDWVKTGLFYGVVLPSKVIAQAFNLVIDTDSLVVDINGECVDPHEIYSYPLEIREEYFDGIRSRIDCFEGLNLGREEFESSLVLADVSKPNIKRYKHKALLVPVRCNDIAALMSRHIKVLIQKKTQQRIIPRSLEVVIYDTDTPYMYHQIMGYNGNPDAPCLPGLIVLGASGTIDAFRWLYTYRVSLIAQNIMKGSLYSQVASSFIPFIFMGVLIPRDAQILMDMDQLDTLRYTGNISSKIEFAYTANDLLKYVKNDTSSVECEKVNILQKKNFPLTKLCIPPDFASRCVFFWSK